MTFVKFGAGVLAGPLGERDPDPSGTSYTRTRWGRVAYRDLGRYYAAVHELQQRPPVTEPELAVIGRALRGAQVLGGHATGEDAALRGLWHTVERACQGGLAERHGVDAARLVATLRELPLFQLAAIVDLAERLPSSGRGRSGGTIGAGGAPLPRGEAGPGLTTVVGGEGTQMPDETGELVTVTLLAEDWARLRECLHNAGLWAEMFARQEAKRLEPNSSEALTPQDRYTVQQAQERMVVLSHDARRLNQAVGRRVDARTGTG